MQYLFLRRGSGCRPTAVHGAGCFCKYLKCTWGREKQRLWKYITAADRGGLCPPFSWFLKIIFQVFGEKNKSWWGDTLHAWFGKRLVYRGEKIEKNGEQVSGWIMQVFNWNIHLLRPGSRTFFIQENRKKRRSKKKKKTRESSLCCSVSLNIFLSSIDHDRQKQCRRSWNPLDTK